MGALLPLASLSAQDQSSEEKGYDLPEGTGKDIVAAVCRQCHGLGDITTSTRNLEEWTDLVNDMVSNGAPLQDVEINMVAQYLAKNFGPANASESPNQEKKASNEPKTNVNKATANELEAGLGLSEKEANAIVGYREKNANFENWQDLKKVSGVSAQKLEAAKDRIVF